MKDPKNKKSLYAPSYYTDFQCIADRCRHSCCIDWEICIDKQTLAKYQTLEKIAETITVCDTDACFKLTEDGRCPHLNADGLCNIILSHGEDNLCEICKNHPRFFNDVGDKRIEVGLGIVCEEACRLILESETPFSVIKIGESEENEEPCEDRTADFDALPYRDEMIAMIQDSKAHFDDKIAALQAKFELDELFTPDEWFARFLSLEILDEEWEQILLSAKQAPIREKHIGDDAYGTYYARLLIYFVYRHVSIAESYENLCAKLSFAILSVQMIRCLFEAEAEQTLEKLSDFARRYSAEIEYSEDNTYELVFAFENRP